jgi:hypothetical protein
VLPKKISFTTPAVWTHVQHQRTSPPPADEVDTLTHWIHLQHIPSCYDRWVSDALDQVIDEHQGTTESWLAITGQRHLGKTNAVSAVIAARAMSGAIGWQQKRSNGYRNVPYVFVEASSNPSAAQVLQSVCRFLGLPTNGRESDLMDRLQTVLPEMGVQAIVCDEGQNFRRRTASAARTADGLRRLLHLPVPMIYSGLDLRTSALMKQFHEDGDSADQLVERANVLDLPPLTDAKGLGEIGRTIKGLADRLSLIPDFETPALTDNEGLKALIAAKQGRPGSIMEAIKKAATRAVKTDRRLTADLLCGAQSAHQGSAA